MSAENRFTAGTIMIWLGVLAWIPFFVLLANGQRVSIFPFLGAHLVGVLGGAALRSNADRMMGVDRSKSRQGRRRRIAGTIMIYLGVLAWAPYFYLKNVLGQDVAIGPFLAAHLTGVLGGAALRASIELERFMPRK